MYPRRAVQYVEMGWFLGRKHAMIGIYCTGMAVVLFVKQRWVGIAYLDKHVQQYAEMVAYYRQKHVTMEISLISMAVVQGADLKMVGPAMLYSALRYVVISKCVVKNSATTVNQVAATGVTSVWSKRVGTVHLFKTWFLLYARQRVVTANNGEQNNATMAMLRTVMDAPLLAQWRADTIVCCPALRALLHYVATVWWQDSSLVTMATPIRETDAGIVQ